MINMKRHGKRAGVTAGGGGESGRLTVRLGDEGDAEPLAEFDCEPTLDPSRCMS